METIIDGISGIRRSQKRMKYEIAIVIKDNLKSRIKKKNTNKLTQCID
jgi:hypothetical protein